MVKLQARLAKAKTSMAEMILNFMGNLLL